MIEDPIVEEIHKTRERLLSDCNDDLDRLLDRYKLAEGQDQANLVTKEMMVDRRTKGKLLTIALRSTPGNEAALRG